MQRRGWSTTTTRGETRVQSCAVERGKEADVKAEERLDVTRWSGARTLGRRCARHVS